MSCKGGNCTCGKGDHAMVQEQLFLSQINQRNNLLAANKLSLGLNQLNLDPEIVEVRFKNNRKEYFSNSKMFKLIPGDRVLTEAEGGYDLGTVAKTVRQHRNQIELKNSIPDTSSLKVISKLAEDKDIETWLEARKADREFLFRVREIAIEFSPDLNILDAVVRADFKQLSIYYSVRGILDAAKLLGRFIEEFQIKINLYQLSGTADLGSASSAYMHAIEDPKQSYASFANKIVG